jgi:hypothetical protein
MRSTATSCEQTIRGGHIPNRGKKIATSSRVFILA